MAASFWKSLETLKFLYNSFGESYLDLQKIILKHLMKIQIHNMKYKTLF